MKKPSSQQALPKSDVRPLKLTRKLPSGKDCCMASLQYCPCQPYGTHTPATHHSHANHTTSICRPQALHMLLTCHHILSIHLPHAIHRPSVCYLHISFMSSASCTHRLHGISMSPLTCHVPHTHTHTRLAICCAQHLLSDENQAPGQDPKKDIGRAESYPDLTPG